MKKLLLIFGFSIGTLLVTAQSGPYMLIGTYTSNNDKSKGIYVYRFDTKTGQSSYVSEVQGNDPSYLVVSPDKKYVFAVNELGGPKKPGEIAAYSFDKSLGKLSFISSQPSGGDHPCYVNIDKTGKWVIAGNYSGGSFSVLPFSDGILGKPVQTIQHTGSGPDASRQEKAHVHSTVFSPDEKYLFVPDLGIDKVMTYSFDSQSGTVKPAAEPFTPTAPGAGPRHFDFHPNGKFAYLVNEMKGMVSAYKYSAGTLRLLQTIGMLPKDFKGEIGSADIHVSPDGKFLYASNRGTSNTIVIYRIAKDGRLTLAGHESTKGKTPRNFNFDPTGKFLLVANQNSDDIVIFKRDLKTGLLADTGNRINVGKPVCIKWID
ncbi:MAG: lactonase family protein [Gemmatimonadaceae bacterium]|nr:lactonase family protein [Chitinophagaceae bacterium]